MAENQEIRFEKEMRNSYLSYAMSVIVGRALPDVRDGLKPVHRRVLFSMHELNNSWNKSYKKSPLQGGRDVAFVFEKNFSREKIKKFFSRGGEGKC